MPPQWHANIYHDSARAAYILVAPNGVETLITEQMLAQSVKDAFTTRLCEHLIATGVTRPTPGYLPPPGPDCVMRVFATEDNHATDQNGVHHATLDAKG